MYPRSCLVSYTFLKDTLVSSIEVKLAGFMSDSYYSMLLTFQDPLRLAYQRFPIHLFPPTLPSPRSQFKLSETMDRAALTQLWQLRIRRQCSTILQDDLVVYCTPCSMHSWLPSYLLTIWNSVYHPIAYVLSFLCAWSFNLTIVFLWLCSVKVLSLIHFPDARCGCMELMAICW